MTDQPNPEPAEPKAPDAEGEAQPTTLDADGLAKELKRAREDAAKYRTQLREREKADREAAEAKRQAELTVEQRAKEAERKAQQAIADAEARVLKAQREARLAQHFTKPDRVIALGGDRDEYWSEDGTPNLDALRREYAEYDKASERPHAPTTPAPTPNRGPGDPKTLADAVKAHYGG